MSKSKKLTLEDILLQSFITSAPLNEGLTVPTTPITDPVYMIPPTQTNVPSICTTNSKKICDSHLHACHSNHANACHSILKTVCHTYFGDNDCNHTQFKTNCQTNNLGDITCQQTHLKYNCQ